jgi:ribosomal protein S18 acetylase RimI-like enzyme
MTRIDPLLDSIDAYCDEVPRSSARTEEHGDIVLFIRDGEGWPFYARPARGRRVPSDHAVEEVRTRMRELEIPETFEWIEDVTPGMAKAVRRAGLTIHDHPLMVLPEGAAPPAAQPPAGIEIRRVTAEDDLRTIDAVGPLAFGNPGTAVGTAGPEQLAAAAQDARFGSLDFVRERLLSERTIKFAAFENGLPVATGVHQPVGDVTELAGIGTLPTHRRRGIGSAITAALIADAQARGITTLFLTAGDEEIARVYESQGFARVGTSGTAEADEQA